MALRGVLHSALRGHFGVVDWSGTPPGGVRSASWSGVPNQHSISPHSTMWSARWSGVWTDISLHLLLCPPHKICSRVLKCHIFWIGVRSERWIGVQDWIVALQTTLQSNIWSGVLFGELTPKLTPKMVLDWSADCTAIYSVDWSVDCTPKSRSAQIPCLGPYFGLVSVQKKGHHSIRNFAV